MPASSVSRAQLHNAPGEGASMSTAPTAAPEPAERQHAPQHGASSAEHGGSARPAEESESSQKQQASAGSSRFTPAQQAVVTALMVVMKRAAKDGREAASAAKLTLVSNNVATWPLLSMLPEEGALPSMKQLEDKGSDKLLRSLAKLAELCAAAQCQPLEVFTRSMQCTAHRAAAPSIAACLRMQKRQQQKQLQRPPPGMLERARTDLQRAGVEQSLANVIATLIYVLAQHSNDDGSAALIWPYLDHILPGGIHCLGSGRLAGDELIRLKSTFTSALQAYKVRATKCGQSFEHMVLLEAAVQGWSLDTPHVGDLLRAIIAAEPYVSSMWAAAHNGACRAPSSGVEETPEEMEMVHDYALSCLEECPPDVASILKRMLSIMDLSDEDYSPIPGRALNAKQQRLRSLLTGLFPGIMEELYCAVNSKNLDMCPDLVTAAAEHAQSFVQVLRVEADRKGLGLQPLLRRKVKILGLKPSELPGDIERAIYDVSARMRAETGSGCVLVYHYLATVLIAKGHGMVRAGEDAPTEFWLLKASALSFALEEFHAKEARVIQADGALLTRPSQSLLGYLGPSGRQVPDDQYYVMCWRLTRQVVLQHMMAAHKQGKSLRAYLEDLAGFRKGGWGAGKAAVGRLIDILERAGAKEALPEEGWRRFLDRFKDPVWILESAFRLATTDHTKSDYVALRKIFTGLPPYVSPAYKLEAFDCQPGDPSPVPQLLKDAMMVVLQLKVHKHIAKALKMPFRAYLEMQFKEHGLDTTKYDVGTVFEAICRVASNPTADEPLAKKMHIHMCLRKAVLENSLAWGNRYLVLMARYTYIWAEHFVKPPVETAIRRALPGLLDCLTRLHKWPRGLYEHQDWLAQATQVIHDSIAQHARDAHPQGIPVEEHIRSLLAVPGEPVATDTLVGIFEGFWAAQSNEENAAASGSTAQDPHVASSASPSPGPAPAASGSAKKQRSGARGAAADSSGKAAEAQMLSEQGGAGAADLAADVAGGANSKGPASQGQGKPEQDMQETTQSQGGLSEAEAGKAEKKKAKKARQRAARAEAAAQKAEAEGTVSKDPKPKLEPQPVPAPELSEGIDSASKEEPSAEAEAEEQPSEADHFIGGSRFAALESLTADSAPADSSEGVASGSSSSDSPQPSLQLHNGTRKASLPGSAAHAAQDAQASGSAAQKEGPWQEVRTSRRNAASQQAASKSGARRAPRQGRSTPDESASAQHAKQAPSPQPGREAAEHLPRWLLGLADSKPQQPPQHKGPDTMLRSRPQASPSCMQHDFVQPTSVNSLLEKTEKLHIGPGSRTVPDKAVKAPASAKDDMDELCVVCWEKAREVIFCHCMHKCTCQGCARDIMASGALCPLCRASIRSTVTAKS